MTREEWDRWQPFLPTPSARRATSGITFGKGGYLISTHALREEGDFIRVEARG